jgi:tetratricopeptide (TPR) repeat protein
MEDAARDIADRNVRWSWWAGRVGALGRAYLLAGRLGDATRIADVELAEARLREARLVEGHLLRLLGDVAAHPDRFEADIAETHYRRAQALAQELGLRPLLAHCHLGLGALYRRGGKRQDALEHLTTAVTMFGEMDMRYWRAPADRMLNELT